MAGHKGMHKKKSSPPYEMSYRQQTGRLVSYVTTIPKPIFTTHTEIEWLVTFNKENRKLIWLPSRTKLLIPKEQSQPIEIYCSQIDCSEITIIDSTKIDSLVYCSKKCEEK